MGRIGIVLGDPHQGDVNHRKNIWTRHRGHGENKIPSVLVIGFIEEYPEYEIPNL
jgi:hypothetical protein